MSQIEVIPVEDVARWNAALADVPHGFSHTAEHCRAMQATMGMAPALWRYETSRAVVVCPFVERRFGDHVDVATPVGISGFASTAECPGVLEAWSGFAAAKRYVCSYLGLHPLFARQSWLGEAEAYNSIYVLDLRQPRAELLARVDRNRRRELRDAARLSKRLVTDVPWLREFLLAHYETFADRVGLQRDARWSPETLRGLCDASGALLVGVETGGRVEAMHLFAATPYAADAVLNVARAEGRIHTSALLWYAVQHFADRGIPVLNLGGGQREDDPIARSKQRFGARRLPLRAWKKVHRPDVYDALCREAGVDPAVERFFPAYRAR